ncbi:hypothetical protein SAMN05421874_12817 [Nonomuraea maritima]|uniref:Uncharacterized protein n=1 Tax=Nonomuraea maritima TaxID=683260 RepID=A0A1G9MFB1_9ACTN|nr:hypothetical protein [Nonomuraea maritima]SDL72958.1 hypothetical protein SAMN05421874_12817 [Nonomuraea maritima]
MRGPFSDQAILVIPDDTTPPSVPSTPSVTTRLGMIHVGWDGLSADGTAMPSDLDHVRVWLADPDQPGSESMVDAMSVAETVVIGGQSYGENREIWLTALDRSGNESGQSGRVTVATQPLVNTDLIGKVISGANIVSGTVNAADAVIANTVTGSLIQANAINAGHLQANAVTTDKLAAGSITAGKLAATLTLSTRIVAGSTAGARVQLDSTGLKAFNSASQQTMQISSSGDVSLVGALSTAFSGTRIVIDSTPGLSQTIRFYPETGNNFAEISSTGTYSGDPTGTIRLMSGTWTTRDNVWQGNGFIAGAAVDLWTVDHVSGLTGGFVRLFTDSAQIGNSLASAEMNGSGGTLHGEWRYNGSQLKTFIIPHPMDRDRWLIHATTESPHNGVEYWGSVTLDEDGNADVELPSYFETLTHVEGCTVLVTPVGTTASACSATKPQGGRFTVHGEPEQEVGWLVKAIRKDVPPVLVEPRRDEVAVRGTGPYRYYTTKE